MKVARIHSLHGGEEVWTARGDLAWMLAMFDAPMVEVGTKSGKTIRAHIGRLLGERGWAIDCKIDQNSNLTVTAKHDDLAFQVQTGNMGRAAYDLLKLQHLYLTKSIEGAALALPTRDAAGVIGSNIANGDRIWAETQLFSRQITVPLVLVEFE